MANNERPGAGVHLALEPWTGTAIIDGERIELPPKEFGVLAYLATRLGKATTHQELVDAVYPDTPWMSSQELSWKIWRLRQKIGDDKRETRILSNRRGFGYFIDLPPDHIEVLEVTPVVTGRTDDQSPLEAPVPLTANEHPDIAEPPVIRESLHLRRFLPAAALLLAVVVALAALWSQDRSPEVVADQDASITAPQASPTPAASQRGSRNPREEVKGKRFRRAHQAQEAEPSSVHADSSVVVVASGDRDDRPRPGSQDQRQPAPAAPTRYLYDLVNVETGDHFVTTDPSAVSEYQARGYRAEALGRVYTEKAAGTKRISTNAGIAYIFDSANPKTSPATSTKPLWLVSDGAGDFYYSTSKPNEDGWTSSLVGYVGSA